MMFSTKFPIRITLLPDSYDLLIEALKGNEESCKGDIGDEARKLREKIEKYGRRITDENGDEVVRLGFYASEGADFIWQFIAASMYRTALREAFTDLQKD